jgi:hypothetical protein
MRILATPPPWPKLITVGVAATIGAVWYSVRAGWLGFDWLLWAVSSSAVVMFITIMLWRGAPPPEREP